MRYYLRQIVGFFALANITVLACATETVVVKTDYLELHTGAGRGYPVVNVVEKGDTFTLLKRKTDWVKVKAPDGSLGWINYDDFMAASQLKRSDHRKRVLRKRWQLGISGGFLKTDPLYSGFFAFYPKPQIGLNLELGKVAGVFASSLFYGGGVKASFFRDLMISPVINLGLGVLSYSPRENLVNATKDQYSFYKYGIGFSYVPYKQMGLELRLDNTSITRFNSYWGLSLAVSAFYD